MSTSLRLDNSNSVGHVQCIVIRSEFSVRFLVSRGADQSVDFDAFHFVQLPDGLCDLGFGGANITDKHQRIVVFNPLHRVLCRQRMANHSVFIQLPLSGHTLSKQTQHSKPETINTLTPRHRLMRNCGKWRAEKHDPEFNTASPPIPSHLNLHCIHHKLATIQIPKQNRYIDGWTWKSQRMC